ncbi:MAG: radical SAM protein [Candidatus Omnitrophica bacterium]|nr:radical SAM protein [Candidatus Omnitrophota bacterium]
MLTCDPGKNKKRSTEATLSCLYINPTSFCNLSCSHCWLSPPVKNELDHQENELSVDEIIKVVEEAKELGLSSIKLTGGEPLLRKDLYDLFKFCSESKISVRIESNGTLISKDMAKMFKKFNVDNVSVSLDSFLEEVNDKFRGKKGAFKEALKGIKHLRDEGISTLVIMSLYKENLEGFEEFLTLMQDLDVRLVKINPICPIGRGENMHKAGKVPTIKEILDFNEKLGFIRDSFKGSIDIDIPIAFRSLDEINRGQVGVCAIKNILGILSDGSVSICGIGYVDDDLVFGNVRDGSSKLEDIWLSNKIIKNIREDIPGKLEGICGICVFKKRCLGACRAQAYHDSGSLTAPLWFCQMAYEEGLFPQTRIIPELLRV